MECGKSEAVADSYTSSFHIIKEAIKIIKHSEVFSLEDGCEQNKLWHHFFSFNQFL
jgi:hypothetical protein